MEAAALARDKQHAKSRRRVLSAWMENAIGKNGT